MLVRGVVDHEVHHDPDATVMAPGDQCVEVDQGAEDRVDVVVVADVVAVVVHGRAVHRRESQSTSTPSVVRWSRREVIPGMSPTPSPSESWKERG
jgi:hypothetical protein